MITREKDTYIEKKFGLREFHSSCLDILTAIDTICKENNIVYSTAGGTMIGHIRHKGFIPWDDDADIALDRDNFNKLIECWSKYQSKFPYLKLCTPKSYNGSFLDMQFHMIDERKNFEAYGGFQNYEQLSHPRVDIFPLDYVPANKILFNVHTMKLKILYGLASSRIKYKPEVKISIIRKIGLFTFKVIGKFFSLNFVLDKFNKVAQKFINKPHNKHVLHSPTDMLTIDVQYQKELWSASVYLPFENVHIMCSTKYHEILSKQYGSNYMKPVFNPTAYRRHFRVNIVDIDINAVYND